MNVEKKSRWYLKKGINSPKPKSQNFPSSTLKPQVLMVIDLPPAFFYLVFAGAFRFAEVFVFLSRFSATSYTFD
jgi:hypothetical protein